MSPAGQLAPSCKVTAPAQPSIIAAIKHKVVDDMGVWWWLGLILLAGAGVFSYWLFLHVKKMPELMPPPMPALQNTQSSIYDNPTLRWSGTVNRVLTLKTLTYRQFDCLDDARQGFSILAELPSGTSGKQGDRIRFHSPRTVDSLRRHGFLEEAESGAYAITDHGLHAVEACNVRY